jgi:CDP-diacylglycerol--serine O-phosphatidyltransferase
VPRDKVLPIFVAVVVVAGLLFAYPFEMLSLVVLAYLALIPVSVARYRKLEREHAAASPGRPFPSRRPPTPSDPEAMHTERPAPSSTVGGL